MVGTVLWIAILAGAAPDKALSYNEAYEEANKSKKPMLVLVGAEWCPACRTMKQVTLPQLLREGKLAGVSYIVVDVDQMPKLSSQFMEPGIIPQLFLWAPLSDGWSRTSLQGVQSPDEIAKMIRNGLEEQRRDLAAVSEMKSTDSAKTADE